MRSRDIRESHTSGRHKPELLASSYQTRECLFSLTRSFRLSVKSVLFGLGVGLGIFTFATLLLTGWLSYFMPQATQQPLDWLGSTAEMLGMTRSIFIASLTGSLLGLVAGCYTYVKIK